MKAPNFPPSLEITTESDRNEFYAFTTVEDAIRGENSIQYVAQYQLVKVRQFLNHVIEVKRG